MEKREKKLYFLVPYLSSLKKLPKFFAMETKNAQLVLHLSVKTLMPTDCRFLCRFAGSSGTLCKKNDLPKY
jgi:hypothetical protein